ncbi:hypothetical protein CCR95_06785 [Thiocystis minor]|uniref:COG4315 family predicted lipoprotein n=1 Tax=Thiocystis minor TaxID=61597 RepID=UPI0019134310|nr:hypothetical protein [Thiocystis minor]MBK5963796.1 hypothetical protein [Thiocystis minor]
MDSNTRIATYASFILMLAAPALQAQPPQTMPGYYYYPQATHQGGYAPYGLQPPGYPPGTTPAALTPASQEQVHPAMENASGRHYPAIRIEDPATLPSAFGMVSSRLGPVLSSARGQTLYARLPDGAEAQDGTDDRARLWRPFLVDGDAPADPPPPFATLTHPEGRRQWSQDGHPLYLWAGDGQTGDVTGDGVDGTWYAVRVHTDPRLAGSIMSSNGKPRQ